MSYLSTLQKFVCDNLPPEHVDRALWEIKMTLEDTTDQAWIDAATVACKIRNGIKGVGPNSCNERAVIQSVINSMNDARPGIMGPGILRG